MGIFRRKKDKMKKVFKKQTVYDILLEIPEGRVTTYVAIAERMGNKQWARAVGNALHDNPDGNQYPCYRVVSCKGKLSDAYAFGGMEEQKRRLENDGIVVINGKVDLKKFGCFLKQDYTNAKL